MTKLVSNNQERRCPEAKKKGIETGRRERRRIVVQNRGERRTERIKEKRRKNNNTPQASTYRRTEKERKIIKKETPSVYHASANSGFGRPKPSLARRR